ncbi:uncharacterized protein [Anas platyrhynchos]
MPPGSKEVPKIPSSGGMKQITLSSELPTVTSPNCSGVLYLDSMLTLCIAFTARLCLKIVKDSMSLTALLLMPLQLFPGRGNVGHFYHLKSFPSKC